MNTHEILYIVSIFLIILSTAFYILSTTVVSGLEEDSVSNIIGTSPQADSTISSDDIAFEFQELQRERNSLILWIGIPIGIFIFISALIIKRIKYGPDLFIDTEE